MAPHQCKHLWVTFAAATLMWIALPATASDPEAHKLLGRWKKAVSSGEKISVRFQVWRINRDFETKETGEGTYYRDGNRFAWRWGTSEPTPVSALTALKKGPVADRPIPPLAVIYDGESLAAGVGDPMLFEVIHQQSWASALEPENVPIFSRFWKSWFEPSQQIFWIRSLRFPLEISSFPDLMNCDARMVLERRPRSFLRLTPMRGSILAKEITCVEAIFHPGESTPYAIRVIDPSGTIETRYLLKDMALGESANIPMDAFQLPPASGSTREVTDLPQILRTISHDPRY